MPEITSFRGLRYNTGRFTRDLSHLVAPPYDVLDAQDKASLLDRHDRNVVAIDLPHVPPKAAGPDKVYAKAARVLRQWRSDHTLLFDDKPAIYAYHQVYAHGGQPVTRKMFFARMRLEEFGTGTVFPHEQTFAGPKEDRLKLMQATRCQLSAIFGLYNDRENAISALVEVENRQPDVTAELQGIVNRLWIVQDAATIEAVRQRFANRAVYIADGHHRYGTALMYRDALAAGGALPMDHPARFILVGLCAMEDPGCVILPTHRVLTKPGDAEPSQILAALEPGMTLTAAPVDLNDPENLLPADSPNDLGIYLPADDRMYVGTFTRREILETLAPERSPAWRSLDLAYLHRYLIDELIAKRALGGTAPTVHCVKSGRATIELARAKNGIALICKPCTMADLRAVSEAGDLMPQKSTFFYPKLATGLVIHPLE